MKLIVGLGNPELKAGEKYANTRHNLGFEVLEHFRKKLNLAEWEMNQKFKAEIIKANQDSIASLQNDKKEIASSPLTNAQGPRNDNEGEDLILTRPQTYMNNSGMAVRSLADYFRVAPEDIIVVHDELDLPLGKIKVRLGGGFAGHHGVESIINVLGTDKFIRVRLGIGNLHTQGAERKGGTHFNTEHFVLEPFLPSEKSKVKHMTKQAIQALEVLLEKGLEVAQNQFN